ncbi:MAG: glycosyltransferase family 2 protein [bacterium]
MTTSSQNPQVAIIILNWNGLRILRDCLESLASIRYPEYTIVVVDNNSDDGSQEYLTTNYPDLKLICNSSNLGFPAGNNVGIEWAIENGYEYVLLLNYDTSVEPDFLDKLVDVAQSQPEVGVIGPCIKYFSHPKHIWSLGGYIDSRTHRPFHLSSKDDSEAHGCGRYIETEWVSGCAMLVRVDLIKKIGLLDSDYFFGSEDADWCIRARRIDSKVVVVPDAVVYHKTAISRFRGKYTFLHHYYDMRNLLIFIEKHYSFTGVFWMSVFFSAIKRASWSLVCLDWKSILSLFLAFWDFRKKKYGKASSVPH